VLASAGMLTFPPIARVARMSMVNKHGLPEYAKLVFKGELFQIWQWRQKMYDGSEATFESVVWDDSATIIPVVGEKILIEDQEQPDWSQPVVSLPGGRCESGEDGLECAKRELMEETGYASDDWGLLHERKPSGKIRRTEYVYIAHNCVRQENPHLDSGEKITTRFIDFDEFLELGENPAFYSRELVPHLIRARYDATAREELRRILFEK